MVDAQYILNYIHTMYLIFLLLSISKNLLECSIMHRTLGENDKAENIASVLLSWQQIGIKNPYLATTTTTTKQFV